METIDMTPDALKTQEGAERAAAAMSALDEALRAVAHAALVLYDDSKDQYLGVRILDEGECGYEEGMRYAVLDYEIGDEVFFKTLPEAQAVFWENHPIRVHLTEGMARWNDASNELLKAVAGVQ